MYGTRDNWEIDVAASRRRGSLVVRRPWWAVAGEDYLFVPFAIAFIAIGCIGAKRGEFSVIESLGVVALGTLALVAGVRGLRKNYSLSRVELSAAAGSHRDRCREAVAALGWTIVRDTRDLMVVVTPAHGFSWGRVISILYEKETLLVSSNAREGPGAIPRSPYSLGTRADSLRMLRDELARPKRST